MELPKLILVGTDFSECAQYAERYATALAKKLDARLYVIHAWAPPTIGADIEGALVITEEVLSQLEGIARAKLDESLAEMRREIPSVEGRLITGDPREGIVKAAADLRADLVVTGTHGRRGIKRFMLGSVADYVVRHAPCPVLAVRC